MCDLQKLAPSRADGASLGYRTSFCDSPISWYSSVTSSSAANCSNLTTGFDLMALASTGSSAAALSEDAASLEAALLEAASLDAASPDALPSVAAASLKVDMLTSVSVTDLNSG